MGPLCHERLLQSPKIQGAADDGNLVPQPPQRRKHLISLHQHISVSGGRIVGYFVMQDYNSHCVITRRPAEATIRRTSSR